MGDDPATSVVDSYGKAHDVDNLYIADGSIFVTSGSANPTCTISALALRVGQEGRRKRIGTKGIAMTSIPLSRHSNPTTVGSDTRHPSATRRLTEVELPTLLRIADCLIPAAGPNPAASDARGLSQVSAAGARRTRRCIRRRDDRGRRSGRRVRARVARGTQGDVGHRQGHLRPALGDRGRRLFHDPTDHGVDRIPRAAPRRRRNSTMRPTNSRPESSIPFWSAATSTSPRPESNRRGPPLRTAIRPLHQEAGEWRAPPHQ